MIDTALQNQLRSLIFDRCGFYFKNHNLRNLESSVSSRLEPLGINSMPGYYAFLTISGSIFIIYTRKTGADDYIAKISDYSRFVSATRKLS